MTINYVVDMDGTVHAIHTPHIESKATQALRDCVEQAHFHGVNREIVQCLIANRMSQPEIAKMFGVSVRQVNAVKKRLVRYIRKNFNFDSLNNYKTLQEDMR